MKKSIEKQIYQQLTKIEAEDLANKIVNDAKKMALKHDPNSSPYAFTVGALEVVITDILMTSKIPIWTIERYKERKIVI